MAPRDGLRILALTVLFGFVFSFLAQIFSKKKKNYFFENTLGQLLLFSLLLPPRASDSAIFMGTFFVVIIAIECFGGWGQNVFQPALTGFAAVLSINPGQWMLSLKPSGEVIGMEGVMVAAIFLSGLYLAWRKQIAWYVPALYLASVFAFSAVLVGASLGRLLYPFVFLSAFFILPDGVTLPATVRGRIFFALVAGVISAIMNQWTDITKALTYGLLWMEAQTFLIDRAFGERLWKERRLAR